MTVIFRVETVHGKSRIETSLVVEDNEDQNSVLLSLRDDKANTEILNLKMDLKSGAYTVTPSSAVTATACVAACGIASFAGAAIECWIKTKGSKSRKKDFIACMIGKGATITSGYVQCVIGCLSGAAFGGV